MKNAELALIKSEAKYSTYIQNAPEVVFVADNNEHYVEVNNAACLLTGYSKKELLNLSIPDLLCKESLNEGLASIKEVSDKGSGKL